MMPGTQVSLKIREDSLALEHFLAGEAAPTVQKVQAVLSVTLVE